MQRRFSTRTTSTSRRRPGGLEERLLAASTQVHTEDGAHALELSAWKRFAKDIGLLGRMPSASDARAQFEAVVAALPSNGSARSCGGNGLRKR
ncbi:MAG: hypothetical protein IAG13_08680 [Deltaproteobacteria bacterium]|nr:hypothetical protein [Nannocystaceae bacterium]